MKNFSKPNHFLSSLLLIIMLLCLTPALKAIIYVDENATGSGDGTSWVNAFTDLQSALETATSGNSIWVAAGRYTPSKDNMGNSSPADERTKTFQLVEGLSLYGGFTGTESSLSERDLNNNISILSGDIGVTGDASDNCYHVLMAAENIVFNGFVVEKGNATTSGGGMYVESNLNNLLVEHCDFRDNNADGSGGAIHFNGYSINNIEIAHTMFYNNTSIDGGAIRATTSTVNLSYCTFIENTGTNMGGGIMYWGDETGSPEIVNCTFIRNSAADGGALHGRAMEINLLVKNCLFYENTTDDIGLTHVAKANVSYSRIIQGGLTGSNNITADPLFIDSNYGSIELNDASPCIDAGDPASPLDADGSYADIGSTSSTVIKESYVIGSSASSDFASFTEAVDFLQSTGITGNVKVNVEPGNYDEQLIIPEIPGTSSESRIIFSNPSNSSTDVVLSYTAGSEYENYTLKLDGADFITFSNMTLRANGTPYGRILEIAKGTKRNYFLNNRFEGIENTSELICNVNDPVLFDSSYVFSDNYFLNGKKAIQWTGSYNMSFTGNKFHQQSDTAVFMKYGKVTSINNNQFYSDHRMAAIALEDHFTNFSIEKNKIYLKNGGRGIAVSGRNENNTLINNFIYLHTIHDDIAIEMYSSFGMTLQSFHNTVHIAGNQPSSICYNNPSGSSVNLQSNNNCFVNTAGGLIFSGSHVYGDYNNLYSNGPYLAKNNDFINLEILQLSMNWELNSISANPHFLSDTTWIPAHTALKSAGYNVGVSEDIEGDSRNEQNPDIGADEFTLPPPVPLHGNYMIGGSTPDYETLNDAADALIINGIDGAVMFTVAADTLYEFVRIPEIDGASATNSITFTSDGSDTAVIQSNHRYTLYLDGADFIRFNQLKILNEYASSSYYPSNVILENGATNNQFTNNYFTRENLSNSHIIHVEASVDTNNIIASNTFENGRSGIYFQGNDAIRESGNQIINNRFNNFSSRCIHMNRQKQFIISGNIKNDGTNTSNGIAVTGSNNGLISNNIINGRSPYATVGINAGDCDSLKIYFNTLRNEKGTPIILNGRNIDVKNNIFVNTGYGHSIECNDSTGFESDYNVLYSNSSLNKMNWLGSNIGTLKAWQESSGNDANSMFFEPEFVSEDDLHTFDLRLNGKATTLTEVTIDIDGDARHSTYPDIGADETDTGIPMGGEYRIGPSRVFKSFTEAIDSIARVGVRDSVIFLVDDGSYNEQIEIPYIPLSSPEMSVAFRSASGNAEDVILEYAADNSNHYVLKLDSSQYLSLENMTINALDTLYSTAIYIVNGTHDIRICNNIITSEKNPQTSAVKAENGNNYNILISGNTITGGFNGIDFTGENGNPSIGNILRFNTLLDQHHSGIYMKYQKWQQIWNNRISHPDPIANLWIGIDLYDCTAEYDSLALIANNMIDYNATEQSAGLALYNCSRQNIFHNNINVHGNSSESRTLNLQDGCSNIYSYNNILSNTAGGVIIYAPDLSVKYFDYNLLHATGNRFIYVNGWINDLPAWNAAGQGSNSLAIDPLFISDSDLHINQVQIFGKGMPIPDIAYDFDGDSRDMENPTIGADVMTGTCTNPLSGIITIGTGKDYETLNDAITALVLCGMEGKIIVEIESGTYNEQVYFPESFTGKTPGDSVIFRSVTGNAEDVIITYNASKNNNYVIKLDGLDEFVLQNITLEAENSNYGRLIEISNYVNNSLFDGNIFKGIQTTESNDSLALIYYPEGSVDSSQVFINNIFRNGSKAVLKKSAPVRAGSFNISDNQFIDQGSGSVHLKQLEDFLFERNTVKTNAVSYQCIEASLGDSASIRKNIVTIEARQGYFINSNLNKTILENNYISLHSFSSDNLYMIYPRADVYLYYNTMVISGMNTNSRLYEMKSNSCIQLVQLNNVMANLAQGKIFNIYYDIPTVVSDHNNLFSNGESAGQWEGASYQQFSDYVSATGLDASSVSANPAFLSDSTWYSHHILQSNTGTPVEGITTDLDGNLRDATTPDMGAEEFSDARYSLGEDVRVCADDSYIINAGTGFDSYQWSTGSSTNTTVVDTSGFGQGEQEISVIVSLNSIEYYDTLVVNLFTPNATPVTDYCFNPNQDSIMLTAGEGLEYNWSTGEKTQSIHITSGMYHYVNVTDEYGCTSDGEIRVHYNDNCLADMGLSENITINQDDQLVLYANQCSENHDIFDYIWSTGDTTHSVTLGGSELETGSHTIWVTVVNTQVNYCETSDSVIIEALNNVAIDNVKSASIDIYPNPTRGEVNVKGEGITSVEVFNMLGQMLYKKIDLDTYEIDLNNESDGIYIVKVRKGEMSIIRKIILKH